MTIPALVRRGYGYGSGVIDPDCRRFILNIPKNASSFMLDWANRHGWCSAQLSHYPDVTEMIVILRDPVERWISGMAQYIRTYILSVCGPNGPIFPGENATAHDYTMSAQNFGQQYNDLVERIIFDVIDRFDDHVWPQHELIPDTADHVKKTYFRMSEDLTAQVGTYLGFKSIDDLDRNQGSADPDTAGIQAFLRHRFEARSELQERVRNRYHRDYELLSGLS